MESLLNRYRNLTVLLLAIVAQLLLLAYQVKSNQDVRLIRIWAVTAVTPAARLLEGARSTIANALRNYVILIGVREENQRLRERLGNLTMENQYLKTELATADRAQALRAFQARTPSRTIAARIIGAGTGLNSRVVFVDVGTSRRVLKGMAVVTPEGIVGKVRAAYPFSSQVVLITDPSFAAGVLSQKNRIHGTLKGQGHSICVVDYVQNEEKVEEGEWFYTSGDDRVFPKGLPVGMVKIARPGKVFKEIYLVPSGFESGLEEVLIVLEGVHQPLPEKAGASQSTQLLEPPPAESGAQAEEQLGTRTSALSTDADRLRERYRRIGEAQGHVFGEGAPGSRPPNFNVNPPPVPQAGAASGVTSPAPQPAQSAAPNQ